MLLWAVTNGTTHDTGGPFVVMGSSNETDSSRLPENEDFAPVTGVIHVSEPTLGVFLT